MGVVHSRGYGATNTIGACWCPLAKAWGKTVSHLLRQGQIRNPKTGRDVGQEPQRGCFIMISDRFNSVQYELITYIMINIDSIS